MGRCWTLSQRTPVQYNAKGARAGRSGLRVLISKVGTVCVSSASTGLCGVVSRTRSSERDAVSEMKDDPSEPACRSRLQTAVSC